MRISIIIATRNRISELRKTLHACLDQDYQDLEIIVLDDASSDGTYATVKEEFPTVIAIRSEKNVGSVEARNRLVQSATGEILITLDDDSRFVDKKACGLVAKKMLDEKDIAILSFQIIGNEFPKSLQKENWESGEYFCADYAGCGAAIRKSIFKMTSEFSGFFFHAFEESDLSLRVWNIGEKILRWNEIVVFHEYSGLNRNEQKVHSLQARNEILSFWMRYPWIWVMPFTLYTIFTQSRYAWRRGWFIQEPKIWVEILMLLPKAIINRQPVKTSTIKIYKILGRKKIRSRNDLEKMKNLSWISLLFSIRSSPISS